MAPIIRLITFCYFIYVSLLFTFFDVCVKAQPADKSNSTQQYLNVVFTKYGNGTYMTTSSFSRLLNKLAVGQVFLYSSKGKFICMNTTEQGLQTISKGNHPPNKQRGTRTAKGKPQTEGENKSKSQTVPTTPSVTEYPNVHRAASQSQNKSGKDTRPLRVLPSVFMTDTRNGKDHKQHMAKHHEKCQTSDELLRLHKLWPGQDLSQKDFLRMCPSIISQIESGVCLHQHLCFFNTIDNDNNRRLPTNNKVWAFGFLAVTIISLTSLCVIAIIPFLEKKYFNAIMGYLVALAVGTLAGDSLLHLIPHSLVNNEQQSNKESDHREGVWTMSVVLVGIYLFFLVEQLTRIKSFCCKRKGNKGKYRQDIKIIQDGESTLVTFKISNEEKMLTDSVFLPVGEKDCDKANHRCDEFCDRYIEDSAVGSTSSPSGSRGVSPTSHTDSGPCCPDHDFSETLIAPEHSTSNDRNQNKYEDHHNSNSAHSHHQNYKHHHTNGNSHGHSHDHSPEKGHAHGHGHSHGHGEITKKTSIATVAWMVIIGDGFHNFSDGLAIGAAFAASMTSGLGTSIAVFCHELPHELGDFAVLVKSGMSVKQAITYNLVSAILSYIGLVVGIFVGNYASGRQFALAITAGLFLYVSLASMLPELSSKETLEQNSSRTLFITQNLGILSGMGIMLLISVFEDKF